MTVRSPAPVRFAPQLENLPASAIREICRLVALPDIRSLAGGWPDPAVFPVDDVLSILADGWTAAGPQALQYGATEGLAALRHVLAERAVDEKLALTPEHILLTQGAQQAVDLAAAAFLDPGDVAIVGCPTYMGGTGALAAVGARLVGVPVDADGLDVEALEKCLRRLERRRRPARLLYVIPNFQNPDGSTLPLDRRHRLVELAQRHGFVIVEDDPYGALRFEGEPLPSLAALDPAGRVILARSFSKTISPGLRLAWVAAAPEVIRRMAVLKQYRDCCSGNLAQHVVLGFLARGLFDPHVRRLCRHYCSKRDRMLAALERHFPGEARWNRPEGGFFVWVRLPASIDGEELLREATERRVAFVPGRPFHLDGTGRETIRLSFSQSNEQTIESAVAELGRLLHSRPAAGRMPTARKQPGSRSRR